MARDILRELQVRAYHREVCRTMNSEVHEQVIQWNANARDCELSEAQARAVSEFFGHQLAGSNTYDPYSVTMRPIALGWWGVWFGGSYHEERWTIRTTELHRLLVEAERAPSTDS